MKTQIRSSERGQVLALVALALFGFAGLVASAIDGGNTFPGRRWNQNMEQIHLPAQTRRDICASARISMR